MKINDIGLFNLPTFHCSNNQKLNKTNQTRPYKTRFINNNDSQSRSQFEKNQLQSQHRAKLIK